MVPDEMNVLVKTGKTYAKDLAERVIWTFLGGTMAVIVAAGPADMFHASFWQAAAAGGFAAVVSLVKGLGAHYVGDSNSASTARGV
jgi:hypothetical protein